MRANDQSLRCSCSNGHKIRASHKLAGQKVNCPVCGVPVKVPAPEPKSISDTGALQILNDLESEFQDAPPPPQPAAPPPAEKSVKPKRACPRCECEISKSDHVCPECKLILASGSRGFKQIYQAALRALK